MEINAPQGIRQRSGKGVRPGFESGDRGVSPAGQVFQLQQAPQILPSGTQHPDPLGKGPSGLDRQRAQVLSLPKPSVEARALHLHPPLLEGFRNCHCSLQGVRNHLWALAPVSQPHPQPHSQLVPLPAHPAPPTPQAKLWGWRRDPSPLQAAVGSGTQGLARVGGRRQDCWAVRGSPLMGLVRSRKPQGCPHPRALCRNLLSPAWVCGLGRDS